VAEPPVVFRLGTEEPGAKLNFLIAWHCLSFLPVAVQYNFFSASTPFAWRLENVQLLGAAGDPSLQ